MDANCGKEVRKRDAGTTSNAKCRCGMRMRKVDTKCRYAPRLRDAHIIYVYETRTAGTVQGGCAWRTCNAHTGCGNEMRIGMGICDAGMQRGYMRVHGMLTTRKSFTKYGREMLPRNAETNCGNGRQMIMEDGNGILLRKAGTKCSHALRVWDADTHCGPEM